MREALLAALSGAGEAIKALLLFPLFLLGVGLFLLVVFAFLKVLFVFFSWVLS